MTEKNINQEFRLRKKDEKINYILEEMKHNHLVRKEHKEIFTALNNINKLIM